VAHGHGTSGLDELVASAFVAAQRRAADRRTRPNARAQRKVAISTLVLKSASSVRAPA
jgi:hypothetical protein